MIPWFEYVRIPLGPISIQVWGLFVVLGMLVSIYILKRQANRFGFRAEEIIDASFWMIVFGFLVARVFHVFLYEPSWYLNQPTEILKIWHGGLSSFGGFVGAALAFGWRMYKRPAWKTQWRKVADLFSFSAVFGWMIGRIGCVMIHDHLGKPCNCFIALNHPDGPRLDMALLEIIGLIPLAFLFIFIHTKQKPDGWFLSILLIYYGLLRFILDFFRATDIAQADARYFGLTPAQYLAIVMIVVGMYEIRKLQKIRKTNS